MAILLSLVCPTVLVNAIYGNTFKARSKTSVNKQFSMWNVLYLMSFVFFNGKSDHDVKLNW